MMHRERWTITLKQLPPRPQHPERRPVCSTRLFTHFKLKGTFARYVLRTAIRARPFGTFWDNFAAWPSRHVASPCYEARRIRLLGESDSEIAIVVQEMQSFVEALASLPVPSESRNGKAIPGSGNINGNQACSQGKREVALYDSA